MNSNSYKLSRRAVLAGSGAMCLGSLLPSQVAAGGNRVILGDFETGTEGWRTNGGVELARVDGSTVPEAVAHGDYALRVDGNGDPEPMVETTVQDADFTTYPYLVADVYVTRIDGYDGSVTFQFTFRHDSGGGEQQRKTNDREGGTSTKGRGASSPATTSPEIEVPQLYDLRLFWDMSGIPVEAREQPHQLELTWSRTSGKNEGSEGQGNAPAYGAAIYLDNVRLTDSREAVEASALSAHLSRLRARHQLPEYVFESASDGTERGRLEFVDGTTVPVTVAIEGSKKLRYTLDGTTYQLGGGWE